MGLCSLKGRTSYRKINDFHSIYIERSYDILRAATIHQPLIIKVSYLAAHVQDNGGMFRGLR